MMKAALPFLLVLASCAGVPPPAPEDLDLLIDRMAHPEASRREEAAYRLAIAGESIPAVLEGREEALEAAAADTASMRDRISRALQEKTPERQVWLAWHALRLGCLARDWSRIFDALARQGCRLIEIYEPTERVKFVRMMIQTGAYVNDARDRHDLFCWVQSVKRDGAPWRVKEVYVGLHVRFDAAFKALAATPRYPQTLVLQRFLELPDLQKIAQVFPFLEEIEFTYGRIRDRGVDNVPAGFHVNAGFVMEGKAGGRSVYYTSQSNLDPLEQQGGRIDWDNDSIGTPDPTLKLRGSGIWGAGGLRPTEDD
jgi:hypothetical protein